jgi:hypothetical protein
MLFKKFIYTLIFAITFIFLVLFVKDFENSLSQKSGELIYFEYNFLNSPFKYLYFKFYLSDNERNFEWQDTEHKKYIVLYEYIQFNDTVFYTVVDYKII